ncbi:MAG: bifunctional 2-polyprenyl-6-hydroxyphenol methylase/3-demethylubiquinol 3-O-methyltransferase UbiG [Alphaproteobacteria bacterium]|nr:bifunctional 2-polyprenyl-6-hydroxyphenol methylase/3-demethylubiquinol 3-O-methyltransferase UbiG [Alphaproteobacteria bacterium]
MTQTSLRLIDRSTVDQAEIQHFSEHARDWWDVDGTYAPLHKMTPARISYIKDTLREISGASILDIGCGGGLVCEPLYRLGAKVVGIDADGVAIETAQDHAKRNGLNINYICGAAEDLVSQKKKFDFVTALEIVEHVSSPSSFVSMCSQLLKPKGKVVFSTLNRTWKSYAFGIVAAERILNWAPAGTHSWQKFIKPSELARMAENEGLRVVDVCGLVYKPLSGQFELAPHDLDINYFLVAEKI